jgi:hypothetical protein
MKNFAAVLIAGICALLLSVCFIALLACREVELQYNTFQKIHTKVMQCRENLAHTSLQVEKYCGQIPTFSDVVTSEVTK